MDNKATSKLISFWLRHKPEDGKLILDEFGRTTVEMLLKSLQERGIQLNKSGLINLNNSFDKKRWEIDTESNLIKATHGHSIQIIQGQQPAAPPSILYHGSSLKNVNSILDEGILNMKRKYVHLSEKPEDALQVGLRRGKSLIFEIKTAQLLANDQKFYESPNSIWLTNKIPSNCISLAPWYKIQEQTEVESMLRELKKEIRSDDKEITPTVLSSLVASWRDQRNDEVVFRSTLNDKVYQIHLTWKSATEREGFPYRRIYDGFENWLIKSVFESQMDYHQLKTHDV